MAQLTAVKGKLNLVFENKGQTRLTVMEQLPPLKVVRAFQQSDGAALAHLHNLSGGVLGGDRLEMVVTVGAEARAQLTTTGATRLYRSRGEAAISSQHNYYTVGENALLEYLPDPLIPFAGSLYQQETRIELAPGAGLFWWETVAPGREAHGELFDYELLQLQVDIFAGARPVAIERVRLEPKRVKLTSLARLGEYRYFSTFYICRVGLEAARWLELEAILSETARQLSCGGEILWGVSTLPAHGLVVRALSLTSRAIPPGLLQFWKLAKRELFGQEAIPPRKVG